MPNRDESSRPDDQFVAEAATLDASAPEVLAVAPTVAGESGSPASFEPTLMVESRPGPRSVKLRPGTRSTVLPRLCREGPASALVHEERARYEEGRLLGEGGLGQVVRAEDNDIRRPVAIKRMLPSVESPAALARFVDEIRTVGQLEHPNIVPIHDVGRDEDGRYYFVMKYVEGETLEHVIERLTQGDAAYHRHYTFERRARIVVGVLEALQYAHARGLVHRDIKPANVMVGPYGEVMLMDWGIAKRLGSERREDSTAGESPARGMVTLAGSVVGTPAYMSPEQARGEIDEIDARSDVYSVCVVFHELLCLEHYLTGCATVEEMIEGVKERQPRHPSFVGNPHQRRVPADLGWIVMRGLKKDPGKRYPSVDALLERIQRRLEGDIEIECPVTFTKRMSMIWMRMVDAHPFAAVATLAAVALLIVGGVLALGFSFWRAVS